MSQDSKEGLPPGAEDTVETGQRPIDNDARPEAPGPGAQHDARDGKKKKSNDQKAKNAHGMTESGEEVALASASVEAPASGAKEPAQPLMDELVRSSPLLANVLRGLSEEKAAEFLKRSDLAHLLTGLAVGEKPQKDMASYKFWQTQPVPRFDEESQIEEGPIKIINPEEVPKEPAPLIDGFKWVTMDLTNEKELEEVYELLSNHYVEDHDAMFRFSYSVPFLSWALKSPGWRQDWHVGVRASQSNKLVAFISGVPIHLRLRNDSLKCNEINFLCVHKKLRSKRLTPVLIKEITRRSYAVGIWQAIYTAGVVLPTPISTCRYFHRSLNWIKLYEVGFSPLPSNSSKAKQVTRFKLPEDTLVPGLRPMRQEDVGAVHKLLARYLKRFDMAPIFTEEEIEHLMVHRQQAEQVDPESQHITDFFSFYCLESRVIAKHQTLRVAYLFYYATDAAFPLEDKDKHDHDDNNKSHQAYQARLNDLIQDALILAKRFKLDVFNALTLLDNCLFLDKQKFGPGDGHLNYYLYNYRAAPVRGGVDQHDQLDERHCSGVGVVML
ncbi:MAG: glycylpeptide N-tetradecanoyltransferase [Phylliscum demangeonii]|nr:MAG: glycylpeptide N-tetradecanoyltransferase [Phylliscum demangeonii]